MIVVTGGAGFIGSNLIRGLNKQGYKDILVVDDLSDGNKFRNLVDYDIVDYMDKDDFFELLQEENVFDEVTAVFHQGACAVTTEQDGKYMMQANYDYSKVLLHACVTNMTPFIYASSAAVYGNSELFAEADKNEKPVNVYGYSKFLFDQYVRRFCQDIESQVAGLRYFNVFGPHEQHKDNMASVIFHFNKQLQDGGTVKLFKGSGGYADGEQRRDFVYVDDVVDVNIWLLTHPDVSGIFNLGTGHSRSFNEVANAVISWYGRGEIEYIDFPKQLAGRYQSYTEADMTSLKKAGYEKGFTDLEQAVHDYLDCLNA